VNRTRYRILCIAEVVAIFLVAFVLIVPVQDHALRQFREWRTHPSPETFKALQDKQKEESRLRLILAALSGGAAFVLAIPLVKFRAQSRESNQSVAGATDDRS
jgi:hypothetical protein